MRHTEANYSNSHLNDLQDSGFSGMGNEGWGIGKKVRLTSLIGKLLHIAILTPVRHSFDLSPNLSPTRREAVKLAPFPRREGGWGLGLTVPRSTENCDSLSTPILRLFPPKLVYLLLCYVLLLGGGLVACSNSAPLGLSGLSSSAGGNVTKIDTIQQHQNAATVYLQGRVINRAPFLTNGAYKLEDATGTIWVLTNQALPNIGDEVTIVGQVQFQSIPIGGQDLGEVYVQEQRQLEHKAGQPKQTPKTKNEQSAG